MRLTSIGSINAFRNEIHDRGVDEIANPTIISRIPSSCDNSTEYFPGYRRVADNSTEYFPRYRRVGDAAAAAAADAVADLAVYCK